MMGSSGAESAGAVSDDVLHSRTGAESQEAGGAGGTQGFGVREVERPTDGLGRVYRVLQLEVVYEVVFSNDVLHSRTGAESQEAGGAGDTQGFGVGKVERPTDGLGRALAPRESAVPGAAPRLQDPVQGAVPLTVCLRQRHRLFRMSRSRPVPFWRPSWRPPLRTSGGRLFLARQLSSWAPMSR